MTTFSKQTYESRRAVLRQRVGEGLIVIFGNNEVPYNYPANTYKFCQDSTFIYYFAQKRDGLVGVIDCESGDEWLIGNDIDIDDIVWMGETPSVADMAAEIGVAHTAPMAKLADLVNEARAKGRTVHFLPPYRHDIQIQIMDLMGIHPSKQKEAASLKLIHAVIDQRACKTAEEVAELEKAAKVGYEMHTTAMHKIREGVSELEVAAEVNRVACAHGYISFPTIFSMHGEILHGIPRENKLETGRLVICDSGCEIGSHYTSDNTRTMPVSGKFTERQKDIYNTVLAAHGHALTIAKPGVKWLDVHLAACRVLTERLKELGLMCGDVDEAVAAGAHALFMPHGLGHMMGLDVHDMEALGQIYVGYDDEVRPSTQFGTAFLRFGRRLQEGFVMSDEPGIYFIPQLIDEWRAKGLHKEFINYDKVETYKDFGGIRLEDDILITADGCRLIGERQIPITVEDVEAEMAK